jgi:hypothetical protein
MIFKWMTWFSLVVIICVIILLPTSIKGGISIINNLTHEYESSAGNFVEGHIDIQNNGQNDQFVRIYKTDYFFDYLGTVDYGLPGTNKRSNSNWIILNSDYVTIPAGEILKFRYNIAIPTDSLIGTYWSIIMVEAIPEPDTTQQEGLVNITSSIRYAIQIITTIENTGTPDLEFINVELLEENGEKYLQIDILNSGSLFLNPFLSLDIYNDKGEKSGFLKSSKRKIYPGTSIRQKIDLMEIMPGKYQALLVADTGFDDVFGINLSMEL